MADTTLKLLLLGEDRSASKALKGVAAEAERAGQKAKTTGDTFKGALGAQWAADATTAIAKFGMDSVQQFAAVEDATDAASVIYGKSMDQIIAQSETAAETLGMSERQVLEAAGTFGTFGKAAGLSGDDLAGFSTEMTSLAGDMASFKGKSPEQAIEAIGAALRGEAEPIRAFGVMLDDATLKSRALEMGLIKTTKDALTPQQKALAAQAEILAQTTDAQGNYLETADSTANVLKRQQAEWEDMQGTLGDQLAPALVAITKAGMQVIGWISQNVSWLGPLAAGIGITTGAMLALNLAMAANPIGLVVVAIGALVGALIYAYQNSETFRAGVDTAFRAIGAAGTWLWNNALAPALRGIVQGFAGVVNGLAGMLGALGTIPGFEWARDASTNLRAMAYDALTVADGIKNIPDAEPQIAVDDKASRAVAKIDAEIQSLQGKVVEAKARGDAKEVATLQAKIKKLEGRKVKVVAEGNAKGALDVKKAISGVKGAKAKVTVDANAKGAADTKKKIDDIPKTKTPKVKVDANHKGATDTKKKLDELPKSKIIPVKVNVSKTGISSITISGTGGSVRYTIKAAARGGIFRAMAAGGIDGAPRIYSQADGVMFNEPETKGESYIPLANDWRRPGAVSVWQRTGRILGQMAAGGILGHRAGAAAGGGDTITINANVARGVDPLAFAREVESALVSLRQRNGGRQLAFAR